MTKMDDARVVGMQAACQAVWDGLKNDDGQCGLCGNDSRLIDYYPEEHQEWCPARKCKEALMALESPSNVLRPPTAEHDEFPIKSVKRSGNFCNCVYKCGDAAGWEDRLCAEPHGLLYPRVEPPVVQCQEVGCRNGTIDTTGPDGEVMFSEPCPACTGKPIPNVREWHRGAPDTIVIRFAADITNEQIEALPKALIAALRMDAPPKMDDPKTDALIEAGYMLCEEAAFPGSRREERPVKVWREAVAAFKGIPYEDTGLNTYVDRQPKGQIPEGSIPHGSMRAAGYKSWFKGGEK